jgi:hypothetical protein
MLLQVLVKAQSMDALVTKCNLINLKGGYSYNYTPFLYDGKSYYTTYYIDTENSDLIRKISENERRNTTKK